MKKFEVVNWGEMMPVCPLVGCGEMFRQNRILLSDLPSSFFFFYFSTMFSCFLWALFVFRYLGGKKKHIRFLGEHFLA